MQMRTIVQSDLARQTDICISKTNNSTEVEKRMGETGISRECLNIHHRDF
jgi:hypothetical protein